MSGIPDVLLDSRNGSAACRYEIRPVFNIVPAMSWPAWFSCGVFYRGDSGSITDQSFWICGGRSGNGTGFSSTNSRCPFTRLFY